MRKYQKLPIALAVLVLLILIAVATSMIFALFTTKKEPTKESNKNSLNTEVTVPESFSPIEGWYNGKKIEYYDFKQSLSKIGSLYIFVSGFDKDNKPQEISGQQNVFSSKRGDINYSDFWSIKFVTVPTDYLKDSIKSEADILNKNYPTRDTGIVVNQPQFKKEDSVTPNKTLETSWANGEQVYSCRVENFVQREDEDPTKVKVSKIYKLISGYNANGDPELVSGQKNIIETVPSEKNYTPLLAVQYVEVPKDYETDKIKSVEEITKSGYKITFASKMENCPVTSVEGVNVLDTFAPTPIETKEVTEAPAITEPTIAIQQPPQIVWVIGKSAEQPIYVNSVPLLDTIPQIPYEQISSVSETELFTQPAVPADVVVKICNFAFGVGPKQIILANTKIIWINFDNTPHTITSDTGEFCSKTLLPGESFEYTFDTPGEFPYHCSIHPEMQGTIIVVN